MNIFALILLTNAVFLTALILTGLLRRYSLRVNLIDHAGHRSAHTQPTPRGGGASIVVATILALLISPWLIGVPLTIAVGLAGGGAIIALIGWLDDHGHVPPLVRLAMHILGAAWLCGWVGPFPLAALDFGSAHWVAPAYVLTVVFIVWMVNLYNFMDGIDGLAAGIAVVVALTGSILIAVGGGGGGLIGPPLILAAAALGFLPWNWPPARIFMGDASSGFLGFMLAALAVVMGGAKPEFGFAWAILPGVFIADATVTLIRRLVRGEKIYEAHRMHAYQRWARRIGGHLPVTVAILTVTWLWLFPLAYLIAVKSLDLISGVFLALGPLFVSVFVLGSGKGNE